MNEMITLVVMKAQEFYEEASQFYKSCGRRAELDPQEHLVVAFADEHLVGMVRLCHEHDHYVLRTMQIRPDFQRRGLGLILLQRFEDLLRELRIENIYCMPYTHLEEFYGQIGFERIENETAPDFLQDRLVSFFAKNPSQSAILMRRISKKQSTPS